MDDENLKLGKIPPQAVEIEEAILGGLMLERDAYMAVSEFLRPESFYRPAHQQIYTAVMNLSKVQQPVDLLTVGEELKKMGVFESVGGYPALSALTDKVASAANIESLARIVTQKYICRQLIASTSDILSKSYDETIDVADLVDDAQKQIFEIVNSNTKRPTTSVKILLEQLVDNIHQASVNSNGTSGLPTGFTLYDEMTGGMQRSDLIILAARPSMGKTALALSFARNMAIDYNIPVAFFSLEMSALQVTIRLVMSETEIGVEQIRTGRLDEREWAQFNTKIKPLAGAPLYIDDTASLSVYSFRSKARRLVQYEGVQMIIVDYLQLMTAGSGFGKGSNREQEVSTISRELKSIAKDLNVPILALSQLNRSLETRQNKKPMLSDLRESGAIEQDADIVILLHRPERAGIMSDDHGSTKGIAEISIAKHRNGQVGEFNLFFRESQTRFVNLNDSVGAGTTTATFSSRVNEDVEPSMPSYNSEVPDNFKNDSPPF